jgi:hypothetical protein
LVTDWEARKKLFQDSGHNRVDVTFWFVLKGILYRNNCIF